MAVQKWTICCCFAYHHFVSLETPPPPPEDSWIRHWWLSAAILHTCMLTSVLPSTEFHKKSHVLTYYTHHDTWIRSHKLFQWCNGIFNLSKFLSHISWLNFVAAYISGRSIILLAWFHVKGHTQYINSYWTYFFDNTPYMHHTNLHFLFAHINKTNNKKWKISLIICIAVFVPVHSCMVPQTLKRLLPGLSLHNLGEGVGANVCVYTKRIHV